MKKERLRFQQQRDESSKKRMRVLKRKHKDKTEAPSTSNVPSASAKPSIEPSNLPTASAEPSTSVSNFVLLKTCWGTDIV